MLPPTEGRADSRMARPPWSEPLSTDALSDPVSLGGTRVRREREGHTMGAADSLETLPVVSALTNRNIGTMSTVTVNFHF